MKNLIKATLSKSEGYKTYYLQALAVIYAVSGYFLGHLDGNAVLDILYTAGTITALRSALTTASK